MSCVCLISCGYDVCMETNQTYTISISNFIFGQYRSRGLLSEMIDMGLTVDKTNKTTATITFNDEVLNFIVEDLTDQVTWCDGIDAGAKRSLQNALAKFEAVKNK